MSFRRQAVLGALSLFGVGLVLLTGLFLIGLSSFSHLQIRVINLIQDHSFWIGFCGIGLVVLSAALSALMLYIFREKTLHVELAGGKMTLSRAMIEKIVNPIWVDTVDKQLPSIVITKKNQIELHSSLVSEESLAKFKPLVYSRLLDSLGFVPPINCIFST